MKRRIIVGSMIAVLLILFVPATNAIEVQLEQSVLSQSLVSCETLKNMDADELIEFIENLAKNYPQLYDEFQHTVRSIERTPVSSAEITYEAYVIDTNQGPQQSNDNQTLLEKIFWKIYNYRVIRLIISTLLFLKFQSKFTLWRTMTWGIRILRLIKIGILLGFIDPGQQNPQTPTIGFEQDMLNKTLTVISVDADDVPWSDFTEIGAGSCDPFPDGNVTVGDSLTNCKGIIVLQYVPTKEVIGVFEFE